MIVRVMGEGQFEVDDGHLDALNELDRGLVDALEAGDEEAFRSALHDLVRAVSESGRRMPDDFLGPSDYVLPATDASLEEVRALLGEEGLLPG